MSTGQSQGSGRCATQRPEPRAQHLSARAETILDTVLDRTVLGGYTSIGYRLRSHAWSPDDLPRMEDHLTAMIARLEAARRVQAPS